MLVVMNPEATAEQIDAIVRVAASLGFSASAMPGSHRTAVAITGNKGAIDPGKFENLPGVAEAIRVTKPHRLAVSEIASPRQGVRVGVATIGDGSLAMIAGPCAIETREQLFAAAEVVAKSGAQFFRGGAFKPRTSPYAFQGIGEEGLKMLADVRSEFGLNIVTEAMDERGVDLVAKYGDCIQIGARNMQNFSLLKYVGRIDKPILLKRGLSATLDEFLLAAEYILSEGNKNVILCERGIRTFADHARNTLDISIIPALRRVTHLPIIVDPSHASGHNYMVEPLARAAAAAGVDGLLVEVHPHPEEALCDGAQALLLEQYLDLNESVQRIFSVLSPARTAIPAK